MSRIPRTSARLGARRAPVWGYAALALWSFLVIAPLWIMVVNSFKPHLEIYASPFALPKEWTLSGYEALFHAGSFARYFANSLVLTSLSILSVLALATLASYGIVSWRSKASRTLCLFFVAGMMIPIRIGSINILQIVKSIGLLDNLFGLLPIYAAMGLPMAILVLTEYMNTIPRELTQAAWIDGAGSFRIFLRVMLPLSKPAMATVAIFNLTTIWNDLWFPLIMIRSDSQRTLMLGVTRLFGQYLTDWTKILATLTMATVPILVLYLAMSRQFIKGLTAGAIKE